MPPHLLVTTFLPSSWAFYRKGPGNYLVPSSHLIRLFPGKFDIPDIDPHLCTHLNYGFANMDNQTWELVAYDPWY